MPKYNLTAEVSNGKVNLNYNPNIFNQFNNLPNSLNLNKNYGLDLSRFEVGDPNREFLAYVSLRFSDLFKKLSESGDSSIKELSFVVINYKMPKPRGRVILPLKKRKSRAN